MPLPFLYRSGFRARAQGGGAGKPHKGGSSPPLNGISGLSGAWSMSRKLVGSYNGSFYTDVSGAVSLLFDQTGDSDHNLGQGGATGRPLVATGGPNSIACMDFDGINDSMRSTSNVSTMFSVSAGWMIVSFIIDTITENSANPYENHPIMGEADGQMGIYVRNTGTPDTIQVYNHDTNFDVATSVAITAGTVYVVEWWHDAGNVYGCVNNGTPFSVASGDTQFLNNTMGIGLNYTGSVVYLDGKIFECATASAVPASRTTIAASFMAQCGAV